MSLLNELDRIKKVLGFGKVSIDNHYFRLHSKGTTILLLVMIILVNSRQYFGQPIKCKSRVGGTVLSAKLVDRYCWAEGTYSVNKLDQDQAHPGIGIFDYQTDEKIHHTYYQWVSFVLLLQALMFYFPRFVWKKLECGRIQLAVEGMKLPEMDEEKINKRTDKLVRNFLKYGDNGSYLLKYSICELLNLVNVYIQVLVTDKFLGGRFLLYGHRYIDYATSIHHDAVHPLHNVFPQVTSCEMNIHSMGGDIVNHDIMCVLPLNIINEKVYLGIWVWFAFLAATGLLNLIYRVLTHSLRVVRELLFHFGFMSDINKEDIKDVCGLLKFGDWFVLRLFYKNIDSKTFSVFIQRLVEVKKETKKAI